MKLRWPRGKWNGRRIVGIDLAFKIDIRRCYLIPHWQGWWHSGSIHWLWFRTWINWNYEQ